MVAPCENCCHGVVETALVKKRIICKLTGKAPRKEIAIRSIGCLQWEAAGKCMECRHFIESVRFVPGLEPIEMGSCSLHLNARIDIRSKGCGNWAQRGAPSKRNLIRKVSEW